MHYEGLSRKNICKTNLIESINTDKLPLITENLHRVNVKCQTDVPLFTCCKGACRVRLQRQSNKAQNIIFHRNFQSTVCCRAVRVDLRRLLRAIEDSGNWRKLENEV